MKFVLLALVAFSAFATFPITVNTTSPTVTLAFSNSTGTAKTTATITGVYTGTAAAECNTLNWYLTTTAQSTTTPSSLSYSWKLTESYDGTSTFTDAFYINGSSTASTSVVCTSASSASGKSFSTSCVESWGTDGTGTFTKALLSLLCP